MYRPLVIGHATAAGEAPANTLAGVRAALRSADAMEIDVQLSADGIPVLMHDPNVDRTTNLRGPIRELTAEQLALADAGDGEPVPTLSQVLQLVQGHRAVFCELKATPGDAEQDIRLVEAVQRELAQHVALDWTGIHSFSPAIVSHARIADPRISVALISPPRDREESQRLLASAVTAGCQAVSLQHSAVDAHFVQAAKFRQLTTWTWTPDDEDEWKRLVETGVDGIITNHPAGLRTMLGD